MAQTNGAPGNAATPGPRDIVGVLIPPAAASGGLALGLATLQRADPRLARRVARFASLALATLIAGNGVGSLLFVQPALRGLAPGEYFRAERALSDRYAGLMRTLMPATLASCLVTLGLARDRRAVPFRLTLAAAAGFVGMLGLTAAELPLNKTTLKAASDAPPAGWLDGRGRWDRFNWLRTVSEVVGWACLCLAALAEGQGGR